MPVIGFLNGGSSWEYAQMAATFPKGFGETGLLIVVLVDLGYVAFYAVGAYAYALLGTAFRPVVLDPAAGRRLPGRLLGRHPRLPGAAAARRLSGDRHAGLRRDHPPGADQLARGDQRLGRHLRHPEGHLLRAAVASTSRRPTISPRCCGIAASGAYYKIFLYYLILALCLLTAFVTIRLRRMPIGRAWEALREDEIACRSLGINTTTTKLTAFAIGAMFGGFAGSFFAARQGFVSPESFVFLESAIILAIVVLGGMGSLGGIAVAAVVMIGGTEILRELEFLKTVFGQDFTPELYRMLLFGLAMVIVMLWKPRGFVGSREPTAFLHERKAVSGSFTKEGHG